VGTTRDVVNGCHIRPLHCYGANDVALAASGGAMPGRAKSNDLTGRSTALSPALPVALLW